MAAPMQLTTMLFLMAGSKLRNKSSLPDEGRELFYGPRLFHRRHLHGIVQCERLDICAFGKPEHAGVQYRYSRHTLSTV